MVQKLCTAREAEDSSARSNGEFRSARAHFQGAPNISTQRNNAPKGSVLPASLPRPRERAAAASLVWSREPANADVVKKLFLEEQVQDKLADSQLTGRRSQIIARLHGQLPAGEKNQWIEKATQLTQDNSDVHPSDSTVEHVYR